MIQRRPAGAAGLPRDDHRADSLRRDRRRSGRDRLRPHSPRSARPSPMPRACWRNTASRSRQTFTKPPSPAIPHSPRAKPDRRQQSPGDRRRRAGPRSWAIEPGALHQDRRRDPRRRPMHAAIAKEILATGRPLRPPACVLSGGETTVTIRGNGIGGRNQEFVLAAAIALENAGDRHGPQRRHRRHRRSHRRRRRHRRFNNRLPPRRRSLPGEQRLLSFF